MKEKILYAVVVVAMILLCSLTYFCGQIAAQNSRNPSADFYQFRTSATQAINNQSSELQQIVAYLQSQAKK